MMTKFLTIFLLFTSAISLAQVEFSAAVNKKDVAVGEVFTFEIFSNTNCQIYQPDFGGLQLVGGPYQSTSTSIVSVNGKTTQQKQTTYKFQLRATREGTYTIGSSEMNCGNQNYKTQSIKINAVKGTTQNSSTGVPSNISNKDFFIRIYSSKNEVYQGEPFTITLKMYSRRQPRGIEELELGEANGISRQDLNPNQTSFDTKQEVIDGVRYYSVTLKRELCFALRPGKLKIESYYISALFSKGFFQQYREDAHSNSLSINVKPLPKNQPKDFNGLVGDFNLEHHISKTEVKPGEAIDINLKITGTGNLNAFDEPKLKLPKDFDQYDPEYKENYKATSNGYKGSITYNLVIVPTFYGDFTIPAYSFSFFDLNTKKYKTLSTGDFKIHVDKPEEGYGEIITKKREVEVDEKDIRYIHEDSDMFNINDLKAGTALHLIMLGIPFLIIWVLLFIRRKKHNLSDSDLIKIKEKKAKKGASKYLSECKKLHQSGEEQLAIKSLNTALKTYLKNKFNLTEAELSLKAILNQLNEADLKEEFTKIWNQIEMYQYAPVNTSKIDELIKRTEEIINQIELQKK